MKRAISLLLACSLCILAFKSTHSAKESPPVIEKAIITYHADAINETNGIEFQAIQMDKQVSFEVAICNSPNAIIATNINSDWGLRRMRHYSDNTFTTEHSTKNHLHIDPGLNGADKTA